MSAPRIFPHAEPHLVKQLAQLATIAGAGATATITQQHASEMLAHITWSRIAEPGDTAAAMLRSAVGTETALGLLAEGTTPKRLCEIIQHAGEELHIRAATQALSRWNARLDYAASVADIERACAAQIKVLLPGDAAWPQQLEDLGPHTPTMLWLRGQSRCLTSPALSVVGTRAATGYGSQVTAELVDAVCAAGVTIISGAAYGIDAVAHRTALATATPTVAVLAGGIDRPYPRAHESMLTRISETGAVCTEMVPGSAPTKWRFLMRNRLIAALSRATLVTEAGLRSGSINTAGHAAQLGRELGAVPGPVTVASSAGCHRLLREYGALPVTTTAQARELAGVTDPLTAPTHAEPAGEGAWQRRVRDAIPLRGSRSLAEIAKMAGLTTEQTHGVLAELALLGLVRRHDSPGGATTKWSLCRTQ